MSRKKRRFLDPELLRPALWSALRKLHPRDQVRNPVMFVVYLGSIFTLLLYAQALAGEGDAPAGFILAVSLWLWATLLFANFAEAIAESRSKAQAESLRGLRTTVNAKRLAEPKQGA